MKTREIEVSDCTECRFRQRNASRTHADIHAHTCNLSPQEGILPQQWPPVTPPDWCRLRKGPVLVQLAEKFLVSKDNE